MKKQTEVEKLKKALTELHKKHDSDAIFDALVSIAEESDREYLTDAVISYLNTYRGLNVVKVNGLNNQIAFEESLEKIYPYQNQREGNLFLPA